jgi:hypothetical protein
MGLHFFPRIFKPVLSLCLFLSVGAGMCIAPQTPSEPALRDRGRLADSYVHKKLPMWQRRLKLQDWKISILSVHTSDLRPRTLGNIHWDTDNKTAVIRVLDASDYQLPYRAAIKDMEFTIVHELIHLELVGLPRSEETHSNEEHAINQIADALLDSTEE